MTAEIRRAVPFISDLLSQLDWLADNANEEWISGLHADLGATERILEVFPKAGREVVDDKGRVVRQIVMPETPFVVWYVVQEAPLLTVTFLRLLHVRQARPR